jgi:hypothetical protein
LISDITLAQLKDLRVASRRPLVICDVDEVVLHFLSDFDDFTAAKGFKFDRGSHNWGSNIRHAQSGKAASPDHCGQLVDNYFATRTRAMVTIDGAVDSLKEIALVADVVMLTNLPHWAGDDRRANLKDHGLPFPVITNTGPKGPAIRHLADLTEAPIVFVDDSPHFVMSARDHAPDIHIVHFLQDPAAAAQAPEFDFVSLRTGTWDEARPHILSLVKG